MSPIEGEAPQGDNPPLFEPDGGITELVRCMDKVNSMTTEITRHGVGQAIAVELGVAFSRGAGVSTPELFLQGLGRAANKPERKRVAAATREWVDGDTAARLAGSCYCSLVRL